VLNKGLRHDPVTDPYAARYRSFIIE
jgi:hypothetical protein